MPRPRTCPLMRQCAATLLLASWSFGAVPLAFAATANHGDFIQVWRRPANAAAAQRTAAPAPSKTIAAAEADLALKALQNQQSRASAVATAQGQAALAHTAAENERLLLTGQVAAPAPPAQTTPPPKKLQLQLPARTAPEASPPPGTADKRAGLLTAMLEEAQEPADADSGMTEAGLKQALGEAIRRAAEGTPQLQQFYAEYLAAEADVDQAKGQRWPQLSITAQSHRRYIGSNRDTAYNSPGSTVGVNLTTTLFDWGQTRKTIDSRKALATANDERYRAQLENLAYQVVTTLLELSRQRNIVELNQRYVSRMQRLSRMLGDIVKVDRGRASELTQAEERLLQAESSRNAAAAKARDAELALRKLIGDAPTGVPQGPAWPIQSADLAPLLLKAKEHPAVRQAAAQARAADLNTEATRASSRPKLSWVVTGNSGRDELGMRQPLSTMLSVSWPLFSGGSQRAATAAARYRAEAQWHNAEQQRLDYEFQLRTADEDARASFGQADEYQRLALKSERIRRGFFEQWYQLGQHPLLDVLSAESDYYNNRIGEVSSRFDAYQAVIRERASAGDLLDWLGDGKAR